MIQLWSLLRITIFLAWLDIVIVILFGRQIPPAEDLDPYEDGILGDTRISMTINTNCVTWSILTIQKNIGNKSDRWYLIIKTEGIGWKLMLGCWIGKKKVNPTSNPSYQTSCITITEVRLGSKILPKPNCSLQLLTPLKKPSNLVKY